MNTLGDNIQMQYLNLIKKIVSSNPDGLTIANRAKNREFIRSFNLRKEDIIDIIINLTPEDCLAGPEYDKDEQYDGWIFKFRPYYKGTKLYLKIRVENNTNAICISIHKFGLRRS